MAAFVAVFLIALVAPGARSFAGASTQNEGADLFRTKVSTLEATVDYLQAKLESYERKFEQLDADSMLLNLQSRRHEELINRLAASIPPPLSSTNPLSPPSGLNHATVGAQFTTVEDKEFKTVEAVEPISLVEASQERRPGVVVAVVVRRCSP